MRTFFGVIFALLTLFCGGCSLAAINAIGHSTWEDYGTVFGIGGIPMLFSGLMTWVLLRNRPAPDNQNTQSR